MLTHRTALKLRHAAAPRASFGAVAGEGGGFGGGSRSATMLFGMAFSGIKCTVAALFSEVLLKEKIENIDWKLVSVFTAFGVGYGGIEYLFYVHVSAVCSLTVRPS